MLAGDKDQSAASSEHAPESARKPRGEKKQQKPKQKAKAKKSAKPKHRPTAAAVSSSSSATPRPRDKRKLALTQVDAPNEDSPRPLKAPRGANTSAVDSPRDSAASKPPALSSSAPSNAAESPSSRTLEAEEDAILNAYFEQQSKERFAQENFRLRNELAQATEQRVVAQLKAARHAH